MACNVHTFQPQFNLSYIIQIFKIKNPYFSVAISYVILALIPPEWDRVTELKLPAGTPRITSLGLILYKGSMSIWHLISSSH